MAVRGEKHDRRRNGCRPHCRSLVVDCKGTHSAVHDRRYDSAPHPVRFSAVTRFVFRMLRSASRNSGLGTATPRRSQASVLPRARSRHAAAPAHCSALHCRQRWPSVSTADRLRAIPVHSAYVLTYCPTAGGLPEAPAREDRAEAGGESDRGLLHPPPAHHMPLAGTKRPLGPPSRTFESAISSLPWNADSIVTCSIVCSTVLWPLCTYLCADTKRPRHVPSSVQCAATGRIW